MSKSYMQQEGVPQKDIDRAGEDLKKLTEIINQAMNNFWSGDNSYADIRRATIGSAALASMLAYIADERCDDDPEVLKGFEEYFLDTFRLNVKEARNFRRGKPS